MKRVLIRLQILLLTCISTTSIWATTGENAVVYVEDTYGRTMKYLILDLKLWAGQIGSLSKAETYFQDYDMNGVRISIYGNDGAPYHPEAGTVLYDADAETGYYKLVKSVQYAQTARGDDDFFVFGSKKLEGTSTFPDWVLDADSLSIKTDEYITMLYDYVTFMYQYGIEIDILGVDNEEKWNQANITASQYVDIVDGLTTKLEAEGYKVPLWMGYEDYDPNLRDFVSDIMSNNWDDRMDIYGVHYYPSTRKLDDLKVDLSLIGDIPFWSTEDHWSSVSDQDQIATAEIGMATIWDQTDQGLDGLCLWDFNINLSNQRFNMVKEAILPLKDAQPIFTDDVDGKSIDESKYGTQLFTRSFREDSLITVFATNTSDSTSYDDFIFTINYGTIDGSVSYVQFRDDTEVTGETGVATNTSTQFKISLPARSITKMSFLIEPLDIIKLECEDLSYSSPTNTTVEEQINSNAAGGYHVSLSATAVGESIEFEVDMDESGVYKMMLVGLTWTTFGQYELQMQDASGNWESASGNIDFYDDKSHRNSTTWEELELTQGTNKLRFISSDKNANASSYKGSFDYMVFEKTISSATIDVSAQDDLFLYPNVVENTLNVEGLNSNESYVIYNLSGQVMMEDNQSSLDVSELQKGIYILSTKDKSLKFVKQ
jgi:hypothetical protein